MKKKVFVGINFKRKINSLNIEKYKKPIGERIFNDFILIIFLSLFAGIFLGYFYKNSEFYYISYISFGIIFLIIFWKQIRKIRLKKFMTIEELQKMDPFLFEEYVTILFNRLGWKVSTTSKEGDDGADSIGKDKNGNPVIIQTKRYKKGVGSPEIRNFIGAMKMFSVNKGVFVTTSYFSAPAKNTVFSVSNELEIYLVDGKELEKLIKKAYRGF